MSDHHVIVGAGPTGTATAELLASMGRSVRVVTRSGSGPAHPLIERVAADATDADALRRITAGAAAIYNCANPPYHRWATDWPPLAASLLGAAEANDAVLVTLSNLYLYAAPTRPMTTDDPLDPPSAKGGVRATMWRDAVDAHDAGRVRVTEARASDFIGPTVGDGGHMGDRVVPRILEGKSLSLVGGLDTPHSWTAIDDVARTLVTIASDDRAWGRPWHVPTAPPLSQREMVARYCDLAGVGMVKVRSIPKPAMRLAGLFVPMIRELREVAYQLDAPFVIDSSATTELFGLEPTPLDETLRATLDAYRAPAAVASV